MAGGPGGGKSTISLQIADSVAGRLQKEVFLVGAEESPRETRARAYRLGLKNMHLLRLYPMGATSDLSMSLSKHKPCMFILDSINALCGDDENAAIELVKAAKDHAVSLDCPALIISQVTKDDEVAGRMALQHYVDTVMRILPMYDEYRELVTGKNRFGPSNVRCVFNMTEKGLVYAPEIEDMLDEEMGDSPDVE